MARSKKGGEKIKEGATIEVDVATFLRTRDAFITGLATLKNAIENLSSDYLKTTNTFLGEHGAGQEFASLASLAESPLITLANQPGAAAGGVAAPADAAALDKKERKKRQHDPNAPKRPLTPFFLYMQTARSVIAEELGPEAAKGATSEEGTKRWKEMDDFNRGLWTKAYKDNLRLYNARMHAYKVGGDLDAKNMDDEDAGNYATAHGITAASNNNTVDAADAQLAGEAAAAGEVEDADAEGEPEQEPEKEPTPPPKATKSKPARKPKGGKTAAAESSVPVPSPATPSTVIAPKEKETTAKKETPATGSKRKRGKKDEPAAETEALAVETPKSKPRKKTKKGDA